MMARHGIVLAVMLPSFVGLCISGSFPSQPDFQRSSMEFRAHLSAAGRNQESAHPAMRRVGVYGRR